MERGEVRWAQLAPPDKERPVLVLTRSSAIRYLNAVTVAPITTTIRDVPSQVQLDIEDGLPVACAANLHNIQTISKSKVGRFITTISPARMKQVEQAICFALAIDEG